MYQGGVLNQLKFLLVAQLFDLSFNFSGLAGRFKGPACDQLHRTVGSCVFGAFAGVVAVDSPLQVVGPSAVQRLIVAEQQVNVVHDVISCFG